MPRRRSKSKYAPSQQVIADAPRTPILPEKIEHWPINRLRPYERNPRTHTPEQIKKIAASLREFGWTNPILVDGSGGVIAGHGRLLAAEQMGMPTVPVIELKHLTSEQRRAYVIADNRLALDELHDLLEDETTEEVAAPEPPENSVTRPGDLWVLGGHRLLCGDSSDAADVDQLLAGAPIHLGQH